MYGGLCSAGARCSQCSWGPPRNGSNISPPKVIGEDSDMALIEADDEEQTAAQQLSWVEKVFRNSGGSG